MSGREEGSVLSYVLLELLKLFYASGICRRLQNMAADPVLTLVAVACLTKIDWKAMEDQDWFPCIQNKVKIMFFPVEALLVRHS